MRNFTVGKVSIATLLALSAGLAFAADSASLAVQAKVEAKCDITATPLNFGVFDSLVGDDDHTGEGSVSITCTRGTSAKIGLGPGMHQSGTTRRMINVDGDYLPYELFQPETNVAGANCAYSTEWGDTVNTNTFSASEALSKATRTYRVCGRISATEDPAVGDYTDTVLATVTF